MMDGDGNTFNAGGPVWVSPADPAGMSYVGGAGQCEFKPYPADAVMVDEHQQLPLTFAEYQFGARSTACYMDAVDAMDVDTLRRTLKLAYAGLGHAGEAGEVANKIKKVIRDHGGMRADTPKGVITGILKELGGSLWYAADVASNLGACLGEDVARANLAILADRKARNVIKGNGDDR